MVQWMQRGLAVARAIDELLGAPPAPAALRATVAHLAWREVAARLAPP